MADSPWASLFLFVTESFLAHLSRVFVVKWVFLNSLVRAGLLGDKIIIIKLFPTGSCSKTINYSILLLNQRDWVLWTQNAFFLDIRWNRINLRDLPSLLWFGLGSQTLPLESLRILNLNNRLTLRGLLAHFLILLEGITYFLGDSLLQLLRLANYRCFLLLHNLRSYFAFENFKLRLFYIFGELVLVTVQRLQTAR